MTIRERLFSLRDTAYADFQSGLLPGVARERLIGVRVPLLRKLARELGAEETAAFLSDLPHRYYDEDMLHALLLSRERDYDVCMRRVEEFLPLVDNWAVCDSLSPKVFREHKTELYAATEKWMLSDRPYTIRFGMEMRMTHFLDGDFTDDALELPSRIRSGEYYVRMMQAWFFATALAKQWDAALVCLRERRLDVWTHNKTLQKARESFRIPQERKELLRTLKRGG